MPAPVGPAMPSRVPGSTAKETSSQHGTGRLRSANETSRNSTAPRPRSSRRASGQLLDLGRLVEQRERALGAGQAGLQVGHLLADRLERAVELVEVAHDDDQLAHRQHARLDVAHSDVEDARRCRSAVVRFDEQAESAFRVGQADPGAHAVPRLAEEPVLLALLPPERLDDPDRGEHLLHDAQRAALQFLELGVARTNARLVPANEQEQRRDDPEATRASTQSIVSGYVQRRDERERRR